MQKNQLHENNTISETEEKNLKASSEVPSFWKVVKREFEFDKLAKICLIILIIIFSTVLIGSFVLNQEEVMKINLRNKYKSPSREFILGTDIGGRSIAGQLLIGGRNSILIGFAVTILTSAIGVIVGLIVGFYGGKIDNVIMRICDFISILPTTMLIITFVVVIPKYTMWHFIFIMTIFYWVGMTRLVRSKALSENRRDYINASRIMGTSDFKIMFGGILPNISSIIIVDLILGFAGNIGIETGLSFLGFGLPPSTPSLGTLVSYARTPGAMSSKLWLWLPASLLILVMMLCINYVGQAFKRASDAKQRLG
ncbi:peptide/nickel transport system permease protein [Tissierella praeacuta DSM 18095]|uniref:Peptide/nickel transport system permease protein n=1 Tax=Tissierella praeacuta DSM 18095 TaxID=1123404 RepID=A0A1M4W2M6_9FIRM|nr:ABC transporter permease [Tissierella praeacuta]SHE75466.1 peptide/nickel transport system permease protein [Tissierella praeacuta DSM 18095]SUP00170.1 Inner membrane ABC transporter permease protein yejE [Tissierella praeacuta]